MSRGHWKAPVDDSRRADLSRRRQRQFDREVHDAVSFGMPDRMTTELRRLLGMEPRVSKHATAPGDGKGRGGKLYRAKGLRP